MSDVRYVSKVRYEILKTCRPFMGDLTELVGDYIEHQNFINDFPLLDFQPSIS